MPSSLTPSLEYHILVVEDEGLIALQLVEILNSGGFKIIGPATSVASALSLLETARPDAAVLDVNLSGERVTPVAKVLQAMRVPFVLASGYGAADLRDDPVLAAAPNLGKPTCGSELLKTLNAFWSGRA